MNIASHIPAPQTTITMEFSRIEGWAVLAALNFWIAEHPNAHEREAWKSWVSRLDAVLRQMEELDI